MARSSVLLVGATGETGKHILDALVEDDTFVSKASSPNSDSSNHITKIDQDLTCFIRTSSENKPSTLQIRKRGIRTVTGNLDDPIQNLNKLLQNVDIVICCISPAGIDSQISLIDAAVVAGVKRFLP
jgi:uncharacterized protein YbjT (DUF2867 family)